MSVWFSKLLKCTQLWFDLSLFDFSEPARRSPQITPLSGHTRLFVLIQGAGNNSACSQEMGCQERGTGGPVKKKKKKWNESYLFRETAAGCSLQQIWSDKSIVQRLSMGSMPEHVHHCCQNENTDYVKSHSGPLEIKHLARPPHIFTLTAVQSFMRGSYSHVQYVHFLFFLKNCQIKSLPAAKAVDFLKLLHLLICSRTKTAYNQHFPDNPNSPPSAPKNDFPLTLPATLWRSVVTKVHTTLQLNREHVMCARATKREMRNMTVCRRIF